MTAAGPSNRAAGALRMHGLSKSFGRTEVLRDAAVEVHPGEFVTLLGPSGCGKTTLLRIVAGFELPDAGSVVLDGVDITRLPANRRPVNTVFQSYALFPHLSVFENVAFGLRARAVPEPEVRQRAAEAMELLRFAELAARHPHQLSGGQRQRVALARALVNRPDVLLLDEPMSALDARLRSEVQLELKRLQRRLGTTFVLVTHDQDEAMVVSDRILIMHGGRVCQAGTPRAVYERPATTFVAEFLGSANLIPATRTPEGASTAFGVLALSEPARWERGHLAIRPERIAIAAQPPMRNGVRTRIDDVVFRGDILDCMCAVGGLRVRVPAGAAIAVGDEVWLELPIEHLRALDD